MFCDKLPDSQSSGSLMRVTASPAVAKSAVIACLMRFCGCFWHKNAWSFSMLLEAVFLWLRYQAYGVLNLVNVDGVGNLD